MSFDRLRFNLFLLLVFNCVSSRSAFITFDQSTLKTSGGKADDKENIRSLSAETISTASSPISDPDNAKDLSFEEDSLEPQPYLDLLQDAIYLNTTQASAEILSRIAELREDGAPEETESFLNKLLTLGPDAQLPVWTAIRPLARVSRRARLRSLRRTLDRITPRAEKKVLDDDDDDDKKRRLQRRRRALVSLLRSMSADSDGNGNKNTERATKPKRRRPAIVAIEKKAILASKESASDLISRRPEGLETPEYDLIASGKDNSFSTRGRLAKNIEIRSYKPYSVCSVSMATPAPSETSKKLSSPEMKGASSFGALAGYLFGKNDQSTAMKMTTPVITTAGSDGESNEDGSTMAFVLPSEYWGVGNLVKAPSPLENSGVTLQEKDNEVRAVLMFGGYASKKETTKRKRELISALSKTDSDWKLADNKSVPTLAQYNDPFTMPWRRLNEVSVRVVENQ